MSFKAAEWDDNEIGDKIHLQLFQKKKTASKHKKKLKQKSITRGLTLTDSNVKTVTQKPAMFKSILVDKIKKNLSEAINSNEHPIETVQVAPKTKQQIKKAKTKLKNVEVLSKRLRNNVESAPKSKKKIKRLTNVKDVTQKPSKFNSILVNKIKKNLAEAINSNEHPETVQTAPKTKRQIKKSKTKLNIAEVLPKRVSNNVESAATSKKIKRLSTEKEKGKSPGLNIASLKKQLAASLGAGLGAGLQGPSSLRERMLDKLSSARFRFLNEQMYTSEGAAAQRLFQAEPEAFASYHRGYARQVARWPLNPLDVVIAALRDMPEGLTVADMGCGEGRLAHSVPQKVRSFDLQAAGPGITACDMKSVPLPNASQDVLVYCLSLMGTNLRDYLLEANRLLKIGGVLKIAEVESRFESVDAFSQALLKFGFRETQRDLSHDLFYFLDFTKERHVARRAKLPTLALKPCLYKKR